MSARTDLADDVLCSVIGRFMREEDADKRVRLFRLARAAREAWRAVYRREAQLSRMRSAYRRRRRR